VVDLEEIGGSGADLLCARVSGRGSGY